MNDEQFTTFLQRFLALFPRDFDREVERAIGAALTGLEAPRLVLTTLDMAMDALGATPEQRARGVATVVAACQVSLAVDPIG